MMLDAADETVRQPLSAPHHRERSRSMHERQKIVDEHTGAVGLRILHDLADPLEVMQTDLDGFEITTDHRVGAGEHTGCQLRARRIAVQQAEEARERHGRRGGAGVEQRSELHTAPGEFPVALGIPRRELRDRLRRAVETLVSREHRTVVEQRGERRVPLHECEAESGFQLQLVLHQRRAHHAGHQTRGVRIVDESGRHFTGHDAAAAARVALEHEDAALNEFEPAPTTTISNGSVTEIELRSIWLSILDR